MILCQGISVPYNKDFKLVEQESNNKLNVFLKEHSGSGKMRLKQGNNRYGQNS